MKPLYIAVDFDGSIVTALEPDNPLSELQLEPAVVDGLMSLKAAGHTLLLYSARANRAIRVDPYCDPLVKAGVRQVDMKQWTADSMVAQARYQQMLDFVTTYLPGVFDAVDDGTQGKPTTDMFIDDKSKAFKVKKPVKSWKKISRKYGA